MAGMVTLVAVALGWGSAHSLRSRGAAEPRRRSIRALDADKVPGLGFWLNADEVLAPTPELRPAVPTTGR